MRNCTSIILFLSIGLSCAGSFLHAVDTADGRLRAVATFSIPGEWIQHVGGDRVDVEVLVGRDGDAHAFNETPRDLRLLRQADIIFSNGLGLEPWLERITAAAGGDAQVVRLAERLPQRGGHLLGPNGVCTVCADGGHGGEHDPHVWLDPVYAALMVEEIAAVLAEHDPAAAAYYESNAARYMADLHQLHQEIKRELAPIPKDRRVLVVHHDTMRYFSARYDFSVPISLLGAMSTEGGDPATRQFVQLVRLIRASQIPAVFAERSLPGDLPQQVAREAGLPLPSPLYTGALGPVGSAGENYIAMMIYNAGAIRRSLAE